MSKFVLISKDAMCTDYLPLYGNKLWKTPNIDALAENGTVFRNHYAAAPSTVMSFFSAVTGVFAHQTEYEMYEKIHDVYEGETLFTKLKAKGYRCHIVWGDIWNVLPQYFDCYRNDVEIHRLDGFKQGVGAHYVHDGFLKPSEEKRRSTFEMVRKKVEEVLGTDENVFLWLHFPHVINGEVAYGSDIELFDRYVGMVRSIVPDECIALTADHGNMNGHKGKISYGHDVYQPAIRIPLIVPRMDGCSSYEGNTSMADLYSILFERVIPKREFVYSDSAYRSQANRKLAILYRKYKYIYNKKTKVEELYDLEFDPTEEFSLMEDYIYDPTRKVKAPSRELYYYPEWEKLEEVRRIVRNEKDRIWQRGNPVILMKSRIKDVLRPIYVLLHRKKL